MIYKSHPKKKTKITSFLCLKIHSIIHMSWHTLISLHNVQLLAQLYYNSQYYTNSLHFQTYGISHRRSENLISLHFLMNMKKKKCIQTAERGILQGEFECYTESALLLLKKGYQTLTSRL